MAIHSNDDGAPNSITYLFTDLLGNRIEELPLTSSGFSLALNAAGPFQGALPVNDARVQRLNWRAATAPNLAQVWVDIDGTLVYGGIVNGRNYDRASGMLSITGSDHWYYLQRRLQAADYSTTWATTATGAAQISHQVIADVLAVSGSLSSLAVGTPAATPSQYGITLAAPISQRMTADAIVTQLSNLGWLVGFDFAIDVAYVSGVPTATLNLAYPRRGRVAGSTGLVLDAAAAISLRYDEQGSQQATRVTEMASGAGATAPVSGSWDPANTTDGYPLLERLGSHSMLSSSATPQAVMNAWVANDLALSAYPTATLEVTAPMFGEPTISEWIVGDDMRVLIPPTAAEELPADPRFPNGMDYYWRVVKADCVIPDKGVPTTTYTFNIPPSSTPQRPPQ